jgi:hypothetical protein
MGGASTNSMTRMQEMVEDVQKQEEIWRKTWKHRKPCEEWNWYVENEGRGFCKHYATARYKHFREEFNAILDFQGDDSYVYKWVYISSK